MGIKIVIIVKINGSREGKNLSLILDWGAGPLGVGPRGSDRPIWDNSQILSFFIDSLANFLAVALIL
jgi:hypothetical protein